MVLSKVPCVINFWGVQKLYLWRKCIMKWKKYLLQWLKQKGKTVGTSNFQAFSRCCLLRWVINQSYVFRKMSTNLQMRIQNLGFKCPNIVWIPELCADALSCTFLVTVWNKSDLSPIRKGKLKQVLESGRRWIIYYRLLRIHCLYVNISFYFKYCLILL